MAKHPATKEPIEDVNWAGTYKEALKVVAEMRKRQKAYFRDKNKADLIESKRLEAAVDMRLSELGIKAV